MARPGRPERNRAARSFRQLRRFHHVINSEKVFGTHTTAPASPWQNGFAERLIGSIRRECLDHVIVLGEVHLRGILKSYAHYYNRVRTHRSLDKDAPISRPVQRTGVIRSRAILGGLHHHYAPVFKFSILTAMAVPIGAVTNAPGIVISVLIHSIQSRLDQRMRARRARVPWRSRA